MTPFSWKNPYPWPRKPLLARNVVATSQPLAAQAGLQMLAAGGNAVDAILATAITLTVVEPMSNGIGCDAFAIVWDGKKLHGLNASGRSPAALDPRSLRRQQSHARARLGHGHRAGLRLRLGRAARQVRQAAVRQALRARDRVRPQGLPRFADHRGSVGRSGRRTAEPTGFRSARSCRAGARRSPGEKFKFPAHAKTLEAIAETKGKAFYNGELAEKIEAAAKKHGGAMRAPTSPRTQSDWVKCLEMDYRGYTLHEIPPNGQGIVALMALGMLEHFDLRSHPVDCADSLHLQIEAMKLAFADARRYVADLDYMKDALAEAPARQVLPEERAPS